MKIRARITDVDVALGVLDETANEAPRRILGAIERGAVVEQHGGLRDERRVDHHHTLLDGKL